MTCSKNMTRKYSVASRRIVSRILGMPGYLDFGFLAAIKTTIKNAMVSTTTHGVGNSEYDVRLYCFKRGGEVVPKVMLMF